MTPTDESKSKRPETAETMDSWTTSPLFPLTAGAVGVLTAFGLLAVDSGGPSAVALGLGVFAALLALRNWWIAEEERPLLAEELLGVHDANDAMREDLTDLRELLTDLAAVVEARILGEAAEQDVEGFGDAVATIDRRIDALERRLSARIVETGHREAAEVADAQSALVADLSLRLQASEDRGQRLAQALAFAVREMKRQSERQTERLDALEAAQAARDAEPAAEETPVRGVSGGVDAARAARLVMERVGAAGRAAETLRAPAAEAEAPEAEASAERSVETPAETSAKPRFDPNIDGAGYEVLMQAIVSLKSGDPLYMETFSRVVSADNKVAAKADHVSRAKADGNIPHVDNVLLVRSIAAIEELRARGRDIGVFCNLSMQSLRSDAFLRALLSYLESKPEIAKRLVFELNQIEVDQLSETDLVVLRRIREKGFAFSLDHVVDWSADIAHLARLGFRYVKLDCGALLQRATASPGAAERLIASFDKVGLELVVEKIETQAQLERITAAGVSLGQGSALAPPRLVRLEIDQAAERMAVAAAG